jgi:hypothetical protein
VPFQGTLELKPLKPAQVGVLRFHWNGTIQKAVAIVRVWEGAGEERLIKQIKTRLPNWNPSVAGP